MPPPQAPLHVLVLTDTAERARLVGRVLRARYPALVLHGPFAEVGEAAAYDPGGRLDYAVVDHELADGFGVEYWRYAGRTFAHPAVVLPRGVDGGAYDKQSIYTLAADRLARDLPAVIAPERHASPSVWLRASTARWCALDLAGERPVYRRRIVQLLESWTDDPAAAMPMPTSVIAHFYADGGRVWGAAVSGNLNACAHTLDELEASLRPELWCRINDRQLVSAVALATADPFDGERLALEITSPLRDEVDPARRASVERWLAGRDAAYFDPDDEEELGW